MTARFALKRFSGPAACFIRLRIAEACCPEQASMRFNTFAVMLFFWENEGYKLLPELLSGARLRAMRSLKLQDLFKRCSLFPASCSPSPRGGLHGENLNSIVPANGAAQSSPCCSSKNRRACLSCSRIWQGPSTSFGRKL